MSGGEGPSARLKHSATNAKTSLVEYCQRYNGKSMSKGDIVYKCEQFDTKYQGLVTLACMGGQEYAGELCDNPKAAEQAVAQVALQALVEEIGPIKGKRTAAEAGVSVPPVKFLKGPGDLSEEVPPLVVRSQLREAVKQILKRPVTDADMVTDCQAVVGGHQASVKLPTIPGEVGQKMFIGSVSAFKQDALLFAFDLALKAIQADPLHQSTIDISGIAEKEKAKEKEKKNKKKKRDNADPMQMMMKLAQSMMGGQGWNNTSSPSSPSSRKPLNIGLMSGMVTTWKGQFGWITVNEVIDHPLATKNQGKVYVHSKDVQGPIGLKEGATVTFEPYADQTGLGAGSVTVIG